MLADRFKAHIRKSLHEFHYGGIGALWRHRGDDVARLREPLDDIARRREPPGDVARLRQHLADDLAITISFHRHRGGCNPRLPCWNRRKWFPGGLTPSRNARGLLRTSHRITIDTMATAHYIVFHDLSMEAIKGTNSPCNSKPS